jgi:hypothetical protein|tara:strand:+ start:157 stop:384 length:228 start_codon:yes stop_codon:yes gene_type:complete
MDLSKLIRKSLLEVSDEFKKEENLDIIKNDLLNPVIEHVIEKIYPYFIKLTIGLILLFLLLLVIIILNIRFIFKN